LRIGAAGGGAFLSLEGGKYLQDNEHAQQADDHADHDFYQAEASAVVLKILM